MCVSENYNNYNAEKVREGVCTLLAKITSYSNFLFGLPGFELNKLPIRSLPLVALMRTQEVLPRRFLVHVCGISAGSRDAFCFIFVASPLAHATLSGSSRTGAFGRPVAGSEGIRVGS